MGKQATQSCHLALKYMYACIITLFFWQIHWWNENSQNAEKKLISYHECIISDRRKLVNLIFFLFAWRYRILAGTKFHQCFFRLLRDYSFIELVLHKEIQQQAFHHFIFSFWFMHLLDGISRDERWNFKLKFCK